MRDVMRNAHQAAVNNRAHGQRAGRGLRDAGANRIASRGGARVDVVEQRQSESNAGGERPRRSDSGFGGRARRSVEADRTLTSELAAGAITRAVLGLRG